MIERQLEPMVGNLGRVYVAFLLPCGPFAGQCAVCVRVCVCVYRLRNPEREFVDGSCCPTEFWSIERLIRHLSIRRDCPFNKCRTVMLLFFSPLTQEQISKIDAEALQACRKLKRQGHRETFADLPATVAEGPRIKIATVFDDDQSS